MHAACTGGRACTGLIPSWVMETDEFGCSGGPGRIARVRYGDETATLVFWAAYPDRAGEQCSDDQCPALPGELHMPGCHHEECPVCGVALLDCERHRLLLQEYGRGPDGTPTSLVTGWVAATDPARGGP
jgi:hypothetical protein